MDTKIFGWCSLFAMVMGIQACTTEPEEEGAVRAAEAFTATSCNQPETIHPSARGWDNETHVEHFANESDCRAFVKENRCPEPSAATVASADQRARDSCDTDMHTNSCPDTCTVPDVTAAPCTVTKRSTERMPWPCSKLSDNDWMAICTLTAEATADGTGTLTCSGGGSGSGSGE